MVSDILYMKGFLSSFQALLKSFRSFKLPEIVDLSIAFVNFTIRVGLL